jgi:hypothetical protein
MHSNHLWTTCPQGTVDPSPARERWQILVRCGRTSPRPDPASSPVSRHAPPVSPTRRSTPRSNRGAGNGSTPGSWPRSAARPAATRSCGLPYCPPAPVRRSATRRRPSSWVSFPRADHRCTSRLRPVTGSWRDRVSSSTDPGTPPAPAIPPSNHHGPDSRRLTDALSDVADGCHSLLELRYSRQVNPHQLPRCRGWGAGPV